MEYDFNDGYLVAFAEMVRADFEAWLAERETEKRPDDD